MKSSEKISFFASPEHDCNYLPDQKAKTVFAVPTIKMHRSLYNTLSQYGFRRSGEHIYRPDCPACQACTPVRVLVAKFKPNRTQRRNWKLNQDLEIKQIPARFEIEHFKLYQRYLKARHSGGGMDKPTRESYMQFLTSSWSETSFYEFRLDGQLLAIAVVDRLEQGLSAVYTFFDPDYANRSLGRFAVLYVIEQAKLMNLSWLYLGYWIEQCRKMSYKQEYLPQQILKNGIWQERTSF